TGGGGYDVYRVVPRAWAQVWLAGAHRAAPDHVPEAWRERWSTDGEEYGETPLPERFDDPPHAGMPYGPMEQRADERAVAISESVLEVVLPRLRGDTSALG
ncbi:MAG: hypothetical protein ACAH65_04560, partial [Chloroflexota bacterium]